MPRINRAIELLEQRQPVYYVGLAADGHVGGPAEYTFAEGVKAAQTWADIILVIMEHTPYDITRLSEFMRGLVEGGPTSSGHRTPTVLVELPASGTNEDVIRANSWMINQILATGVHGLLLCHADAPDAVRAFVEQVRFPFSRAGVGDILGEGRRGSGGQRPASEIWGVSIDEYFHKADVWPLNPDGEILLGIKIENKRGLANAEANAWVPGIAFVEWAPLDMSLSLGALGGNVPPYPPVMEASRQRVVGAAKAANIAYCGQVRPHNIVQYLAEGMMVGVPMDAATAEIGRRHTGRTMRW
jgi:4-hydroxy-2-oxoheptanedioate aldolase